MKMLTYAGIGSRETPEDVLELMRSIAQQLAPNWILRSGYAAGADRAFYDGAAASLNFEMYLPWHGYNQAPTRHSGFIVPELDQNWENMARYFHPAWDKFKRDGSSVLSDGARKMHMRNIGQILGRFGPNNPSKSDMVICWTPGGKAGGGTGQAIRMANYFKIPVFNLAIEKDKERLDTFVNQKNNEP